MKRIYTLEEVLCQAKQTLANQPKNSDAMSKVKEYIRKNKLAREIDTLPKYHVTGEVGWINDPNGFSFYNGFYHLFYQYHPYDIKWGPMHWGHAVTKDFIKWEQLPVALAPDSIYDVDGCFSGSGIQVGDMHVLMYTGNINPKPEDPELIRQVQCIAIGDGINYTKIGRNSVISTNDLPRDSNLSDFRDPKIFKKEDSFYTVVGSRHEDGSGQILLYRSLNLIDWEYVGTLCRSENKIGRMWECPDLFELDGKDVLLMSPQQMEPIEYEYHNGNCTTVMIGEMNFETGEYSYPKYEEIDYGMDFYAPQTLETPDGRRIMIAWMQAWDRDMPSAPYGWVGAMTLPRELKVVNGKLIQKPVREIMNYRKNEVNYQNLTIKNVTELKGINGRIIELNTEIDMLEAERLTIKFMKNDMYETVLYYDKVEGVIGFDRTASGSGITQRNEAKAPVTLNNNQLTLQIFMDTFSVEVFINEGEKVMSTTVFTPIDAQGITFEADQPIIMNVSKWDLAI